jgi:hypothetical protein
MYNGEEIECAGYNNLPSIGDLMKSIICFFIVFVSININAATLKCEFSGAYSFSPSTTYRTSGRLLLLKESITDLGSDLHQKVEIDKLKYKAVYKGHTLDFKQIDKNTLFFLPPQDKPDGVSKFFIYQAPITITIGKNGEASMASHTMGGIIFSGGYCR